MQIPIFQIDAFTSKVFGGNPAAICPLEKWLPDHVMQRIALENCVAETAFFIPKNEGFAIRWFTPEIEMDLCGHATLAAAHVIARHLGAFKSTIVFQSNSGTLKVLVEENILTLDFPSRMPLPCDVPDFILDAFQSKPIESLKSRDYVLVFENEKIIHDMRPNQQLLEQINLDPGGIIITSPGDKVDFVSRFFTPQASIFEDPVTGSAHCSLIPYWSKKLGKQSLQALQLSPRGGELVCKNLHDRVLITGQAVTYLQGTIEI